MEPARAPEDIAAMAKKVISRLKPEPQARHFIRQWRKHRGLTQERLAERIDMSMSSISQLENGKQNYTQATLEAIADALQCSPGDLLMRDPTDGDAIWSIWEGLKAPQRQQALEVLRILSGPKAA